MIRPPGSRREGPSRAPRVVAVSLSLVMAVACMSATAGAAAELAVQPRVVTGPVRHDTDDPSASLVLGTDKDVDGALFAIVSRSDQFAPTDGHLHQYRLVDDGKGMLRGVFVRAFGQWSGRKEIEALAVDNELGYVYASDETYGVRKYHADPLAEDAEDKLATFATTDTARDHEGLSIYRRPDGTGYILLSDQQANLFRIYPREGLPGRPHEHPLVGTVRLSTLDSDGSDLTTVELPGFPGGLFVAMSTDRTFHLYAVKDLLEAAGLDR